MTLKTWTYNQKFLNYFTSLYALVSANILNPIIEDKPTNYKKKKSNEREK